jgi:membrane protease YdiL (CAAX protease family)
MTKKNKQVFNVYFIYFLSMMLFSGVRIIASLGVLDNFNNEISSIIFTVIIQVLIMFFIPFTIYSIMHLKDGGVKKTLEMVNLKKVKFKVVLIAIALGVLAFFINIAVSTVFSGVLSFFGYQFPSLSTASEESLFNPFITFIIDLTLIGILPALCEEFLHRGILLNGLNKIGFRKAILISSLMFGLIHFNVNQFSYAFVLGLLMGFVAVVSKSLWPAIIIHFVNNGISVYLSHANINNWVGSNFYDIINNFLISQNFILTFTSCFLFLGLIVVAVFWLIAMLFKLTTVNQVQNAINSIFELDLDNLNLTQYEITEKRKILSDILLNKSSINVDYEATKNPIDLVLPKERDIYKIKLIDNLFLVSSIVLGGLVTIFTFIWGLL